MTTEQPNPWRKCAILESATTPALDSGAFLMSAAVAAVAPGSPSIPNSILPLLLCADADSASLQEKAVAAKSDWAVFLTQEGALLAGGSIDYQQAQALSAAITRFLRKTSGSAIDIDTMKTPQIIARMCEYAGAVFQTCFGPSLINHDPIKEKEVLVAAKNDFDGDTILCGNAIPLQPIKTEEIREPCEPGIFPYDKAFHRLQDELRKLEKQGEEIHTRLDALTDGNNELQLQLDTLDDRMTHRLARARARHIRFIVRLDEEWLMDSDTIEENGLPCAKCAENRAKKPRLPYPSPAPATPTAAATAADGN